MSKHEQEARIAHMQNSLSAFQNQNSPNCKSYFWLLENSRLIHLAKAGGYVEQSVEHQGSEEDDDDEEDSESEAE